MNRGKKPLSSRNEKKMAKEIRNANREGSTELPEGESISETLHQYPQKEAKKYKESLDSMNHDIHTKKAKREHKRSKRSTPGETYPDSGPHIPHVEGKKMHHERHLDRAKANIQKQRKK